MVVVGTTVLVVVSSFDKCISDTHMHNTFTITQCVHNVYWTTSCGDDVVVIVAVGYL